MVSMRLIRMGRTKAPTYRLVVQDKRRAPGARFLEILGHYNPRSKEKALVFKQDRVEYWLSVGAQPSDTVHNLLIREGVIKSDKKKPSVHVTKKRKAKMDEKKAEAESAQKEAEEAAKAEAEETPAEAPAEEAKEEAPAESAAEETKEEAPAEEKAE